MLFWVKLGQWAQWHTLETYRGQTRHEGLRSCPPNTTLHATFRNQHIWEVASTHTADAIKAQPPTETGGKNIPRVWSPTSYLLCLSFVHGRTERQVDSNSTFHFTEKFHTWKSEGWIILKDSLPQGSTLETKKKSS